MAQQFPSIHVEQHDEIMLLRIQHGKVNAMDIELFQQLVPALDEAEKSNTKALVLTGSGKAFSAGVDLFRILSGGTSYIVEFLPLLNSGLEKLFMFPKPVVAAMNGHAIAGGCILSCACDYRIMAAGSGAVGVPELLVGVPFPSIALEILRFACPQPHFQNIVYSGSTFDSDQCLIKGLIDEIVEPHLLIDRAVEKARSLAEIPSASFALVKKEMRGTALQNVQASTFDSETLELWKSPQIHDVIRRYLDKTIGRNKQA